MNASTIPALVAVGLGLAAAACNDPTAGSAARRTSDRAPPFELRSHEGETVSLEQITASGPAVVVFYRGHW